MTVEDNKRLYSRASTLLPFTVRRSPDQSSDITSRLVTDVIIIDDTLPPRVDDDRLNSWLTMLNTKLEYLISMNSPKNENVVFMAFSPLNISGNGMSLMTKEPFNLGDVLEMRIVLQTYPPKILFLYGELVRIDTTPGETETFIVGVKFLGMNEEVLQEITRFDYKKHRERLITGQKS